MEYIREVIKENTDSKIKVSIDTNKTTYTKIVNDEDEADEYIENIRERIN